MGLSYSNLLPESVIRTWLEAQGWLGRFSHKNKQLSKREAEALGWFLLVCLENNPKKTLPDSLQE